MNNLNKDPDILETVEVAQIPLKKYAIIWAIMIAIVCIFIFVAKTSSASKTIDSRLSELKQLRDQKKSHEAIIENEKKAIFVLDQKIIPAKCTIFKETGAKDSWENECRDHFEEQKTKIQQQAVESISEEIPE